MKINTIKKIIIFLLIIILTGIPLIAQNGSLLVIRTGIDYMLEEKPSVFNPGFISDMRMYFFSDPDNLVQFGFTLDYLYLPLQINDSVSLLEIGGLGSLYLPLTRRMNLRLDVSTGVNAGILNSVIAGTYKSDNNTPWGIAGYAGIDLILSWYINPNISLATDVGFRYAPGLYTGVTGSIGASFHIPTTSPQIDILEIQTTPVLPAFKEYYLDHPVLRIDLKNNERFPLDNLAVKVKEGNANREGTWIHASSLLSGATTSVYIPVPWLDTILDRAGTSTETIHFDIAYKASGTKRLLSWSANCDVMGHNNFIWQSAPPDSETKDAKLDQVLLAEDGKAAVFVDPNDANMVSLVQDIQKLTQESLRYDGLKTKFRSVLSVVAYLQSRSIHYQVDPNSIPYGKADKGQVDFLRYPSETLHAGYGDCDDFSILVAALLEAAGVPTAFITVPGHIYVAADCGLESKTISGLFGDTSRFIKFQGNYWIPIEVTAISEGIKTSWETGLNEWNETITVNRAFYPLNIIWQEFRPSAIPWKTAVSDFRPGNTYTAAVNKARKEISGDILTREYALARERMQTQTAMINGREYSRLASRAFMFGELEEAFSYMKQAIMYDPSYSNYYNAGLIAFRIGNITDSLMLLNLALAINNTEKARALLSYIQGSGTPELDSSTVDSASIERSDIPTRGDEVEIDFPWEEEK